MIASPDPLRSLPLRYRIWLKLLPAHVRDQHGRELRDELRSAPVSAFDVAIDMLRASPRAHWDVLRQDLHLALRQLRRDTAFAIIACLTLATGIGGNVAFFSLVDGVLLRQLPILGAERVVDITEENVARNMRNFGISPANFRDLTRDSLFYAAAIFNTRSGTLAIGETRERVSFTAVSGDFFRVFVESPVLGRTLRPEDDVAGNNSIVVSHAFWQRVLGSDAQTIGREIELDGKPLRVVGVMPAQFDFPSSSTDFWQPLALSEQEWQRRGARFVAAVARLKSGATVADAARSTDRMARGLAEQYPRTNGGWSVVVRELRAATVSSVRTPLLLIWGAGALVLVIAVANVASLFAARAITRERELALRAALGARLPRLVRQLGTEATVLVTLSAVAGIGVAYGILKAIRPLALNFIPRMQEVAIGVRTFGYTALLLLLTTVLLAALATGPLRTKALWTSLGSLRASASPRLRRRQRRVVIAEVALAVFALVGSALVVRTLAQLLAQPRGFDPHELLTFRVEPPWHFSSDGPLETVIPAMAADRRRVSEAYEQLTDRLMALPGVRSAGAINRLPLTGNWWTTGVRLPERVATGDSGRVPAYVRPVTASYLQAMGTRLIRGRAFTSGDNGQAEPVLIVDAEFAQRIWGDMDPLGREVMLDGAPNAPPPRARVVGVVEAIHMNRLDDQLRPTMYVPLSQAHEGHYLNWGMDVVVRGATMPMQEEIRRAARAVFPDAAVFRIQTMESIVDLSTAQRRFQLVVLTFFGLLAVLLATIGIGGALMLSVRERRGELAVKLALGAVPRRLWWNVQREGLILAGIGCAIGVVAALAGARLFSALVYGVSVRDPVAFVAAPTLMLMAAFIALAVPASRAAQASPLAALRE